MKNILRNYSLTRKLFIGIALGTALFSGENTVINAATEPAAIYRTAEEWSKRFALEPYAPNMEITGEYDQALAAKCINGTFVGYMQDEVKVWKGIPYSKQPVGENRFMKATDPEPSDKVFEAKHFGPTCMQSLDEQEMASQYKQAEDCLNLNIWSNSTSIQEKKPVLVFVHGGGWVSGGTSDPLYDGYNFAHNNPDVILVTITYRMGMMGMINLSSFEGGENYEHSRSNGITDQVQALKWIKQNISAFGGDSENITYAGESAGGGSVSLMCILPEAKGLIQKAIPMSGGVNQANPIELTSGLTEAVKAEFKCKSVKELQNIPFERMMKWWGSESLGLAHHVVKDGKAIPTDPIECWKRGDTKDLIILQGHTSNEFAYYISVFLFVKDFYDAMCESFMEKAAIGANDEYKAAFNDYVKALNDLGYTGKEIARQFANDFTLAAINTYQAVLHAQNNGKGYCYTFNKNYDGEYKELGAAHAVDCYYMFGNFNGNGATGNKEEVDLSIKFQKMIANFCKTGNPSIEGLEWPDYQNETRYKMIIDDNCHVEKNPEGARVEALMRMMASNENFRYGGKMCDSAVMAKKKNPEAYKEYVEKLTEMQNSIDKALKNK